MMYVSATYVEIQDRLNKIIAAYFAYRYFHIVICWVVAMQYHFIRVLMSAHKFHHPIVVQYYYIYLSPIYG